MIPLPAKKRGELRAQAHRLTPVVIIGDKGLTDDVIAEIDRSLKAHELIKVRAAGGERDVRDIWLDTICERLGAQAVQQIGKMLVIYRKNPDPVPEPARVRGEERKERRESTATAKARIVSEQARAKQRARDAKKRRERDAVEMARKGKYRPEPPAETLPGQARPRGARGGESVAAETGVNRTSRPRSRTPSPLPESGPRRRRPRTFR